MSELKKINETKQGDSLPGIGFEELREGRCKFPLGDIAEMPDRFCGEAPSPGCPIA